MSSTTRTNNRGRTDKNEKRRTTRHHKQKRIIYQASMNTRLALGAKIECTYSFGDKNRTYLSADDEDRKVRGQEGARSCTTTTGFHGSYK
jgi:hypothetical protein